MPGSHYAGSCLVKVEGSPLPTDVDLLLAGAVVDSYLHLPDAFALHFRDPDRIVLRKSGIDIASTIEIAVETTEQGRPRTLIAGEVTALEAEVDGEGSYTLVRGYDRTHRLRGSQHTGGFWNMSHDQIVRRVLTRAGLTCGSVKPTRTVHPYVPQGGLDDWTFLAGLARQVGFELTMTDGKVNFEPPTDASTAAAATGDADPYLLEPGADLLSLRSTVNAAQQVSQVQVRSWDQRRKQPVVASAPANTTSAALSVRPGSLANRFGGTPYLRTGVVHTQQADAQQAAQALAERIGSGFAELDGVVRGEPRLLAGHPVTIANLGKPFDGCYTLTRTRQTFDPEEGYNTAIWVTGAQERSLTGLTGGGGSGDGRMPGVVVGVVTDTGDPEQLGRVKLRLPWLAEDQETDWAPTAQPGAGNNRGAVVLPEVDDQVLVAFEHGELAYPYVIAGLHSAVASPPMGGDPVNAARAAVNRRAFVSRDGHALQFLDSGSAAGKGMSLATGDDKLTLVLDSNATRIAVTSMGTVLIDAANGVRIQSTQGDIELSGRQIKLDAVQGVSITGGTEVTVAARAKLDLSGAATSLRGNGSTEVRSGGSCVIAGSLVKIN
ncbi:MAG: VgrG-related protein [Sciscionella sp.]